MADPVPAPADVLKGLQSEAEALAKRQAATAADAKAMQTSFEEGEKEIATYVAEHDKLESDTNAAKDDLKALVDRIKQHSAAVATQVDAIITTYDAGLAAKVTAYQDAKDAAAAADAAMKAAQKDAEDKQADFEKKKGKRFKQQLDNLQKSFKTADAKNDADAYAEAYTIAKLPYAGAEALPSVTTFVKNVRDAWDELRKARESLRLKTDDYFRAARKVADLHDTIQETEAKRAENVLRLVTESQPNVPPDTP